MSTNADYSVPDNNSTTQNIPDCDRRVWAPIDTRVTERGVQPAYVGTIGWDAPYPPAYYGNTGSWGLRTSSVIAPIDVDDYDDKHGADTISELEDKLGKLPETYRVTARGYLDQGGKSLYRVPGGVRLRDVGKDVETLQRRFIAMGTHHKTGNAVCIYDDRTTDEVQLHEVRLENIPELPQAWLEHLTTAASGANTSSPDDNPGGAPNPASRPYAPEQGIGSRTGSADYDGGLLGYAKDLRAAGAGSSWIESELTRVARADGAPWTANDLATLASEAVKTRAVDPYASAYDPTLATVIPLPLTTNLAPEISGVNTTPDDDTNGWGSEAVILPPFKHLQIGAGGYSLRKGTPVCVYAPPSYGKTAFDLQWAMQEVRHGRRVLWGDLEDQRANIEDTIRESGAWEAFRKNVTYVSSLADLRKRLEESDYDIVFLDSYQVAVQRMNLEPAVLNSYERTFGAYFDAVVRPVTSRGITFVTLDHATKTDRSKPNVFELSGAARKMADYRFILRIERHTDGYATLVADKDSYARAHRDEGYRPYDVMGYMALATGEFRLTSPDEDTATIDDVGSVNQADARRIVVVLAAGDYPNKTALARAYAKEHGLALATGKRHVDAAYQGNVIDTVASPVRLHPDCPEKLRALYKLTSGES